MKTIFENYIWKESQFIVSNMKNTLSNIILHKIVGSKPRLGQTQNNKIGICCFYTKYAALRGQNKDYQIGSCAPLITQHNVPGWRSMPYSRLLFQYKGSWAREHLPLASYNLYQLKTNKTHLKYYIKLMVFYRYIYKRLLQWNVMSF
jgi:hypothetical protein